MRWTLVVPAGLLLSLSACRDGDPDDLVRKTIGPAGGLISSHDQVVTVVLQPGALSEDVEIEIFPSDAPPPIFGPAYRVRPDIMLSVDAEVTYRRVLPSNPNAALVGAIALDDYTSEMGYWRPLPRLALNSEQQSVIASDNQLSLFYGLLEDPDAPAPPPGTTGETTMDPPSTDDGTTMGPGSTDDGTTTGPVDPTTMGPESTDEGPPPGTTTDDPPGSTGPGDTAGEMGMTDDGMMMPVCGDGMAQVGELCLVAGADYAAGTGPLDVGVGNFNADPALDVVALDGGTQQVVILPGNGDGTLMAPVGATAVGAAPAEMAVADFTGEGALDVAVLDTGANSVGVLAGDGAGGFAAQVSTAAGLGLVDLDVGDFDGNAAADVGVLNAGDGTVQLLLGGGGGLTAGPTAMVNAGVDATVGVGSLNAAFDPFDDIIGVGAGGYHAWATDGAGAGYVGDVPGAFGGGGTFVEVVVGDIDGDGNPDVVGLDVASDTMVVGMSTGGPATFDFAMVPPLATGTDPSDVVLADLDGDGDLDAVVCNATSADVMVYVWNAGYMLAETFPTGMAPSGVAVGELSGDGVPDIVVSNEGSDTVTVVVSDP